MRIAHASLLAAVLGLPPAARADDVFVPRVLVHNGRLRDALDQPVTATLNVTFTIYQYATVPPAPIADTSFWTRTMEVHVFDGVYSVTLDDLPDAALDGADRYLEMKIGTDAMTPRLRLATTAYAFRAETAKHLRGGTVDAAEIKVGGDTVIDATGHFVGPHDNFATSWDDLDGVPQALRDGDYYTQSQADGEIADAVSDAGVSAALALGTHASDAAAHPHAHTGVYAPAGSYADASHTHAGTYADASHTHAAPTGFIAGLDADKVDGLDVAAINVNCPAGQFMTGFAFSSGTKTLAPTCTAIPIATPGTQSSPAGTSCKDIRNRFAVASSGAYWIDAETGGDGPLNVYCDMATDGGGWTLCYADAKSYDTAPIVNGWHTRINTNAYGAANYARDCKQTTARLATAGIAAATARVVYVDDNGATTIIANKSPPPALANGTYTEFTLSQGPYNIGIEINNPVDPGRGHCFDSVDEDNSWGRAGRSESCYLDTQDGSGQAPFYSTLISVEYWLR